jgi:hypothetical protein
METEMRLMNAKADTLVDVAGAMILRFKIERYCAF